MMKGYVCGTSIGVSLSSARIGFSEPSTAALVEYFFSFNGAVNPRPKDPLSVTGHRNTFCEAR
jgi:hypothetical protein